MTTATRKPLDMTYHNAVKNMEDSSRAGIPQKVGAVTVPSDILPLIQVNAYARIENEHTGRCTYKYIAEAHAFTLNGINYWSASLYLRADEPDQQYLSWEHSSMNRADDNREAPDRAREIVMEELRRAINEVRKATPAGKMRHDAFQDQADRYRAEQEKLQRRIDHLQELGLGEFDAR